MFLVCWVKSYGEISFLYAEDFTIFIFCCNQFSLLILELMKLILDCDRTGLVTLPVIYTISMFTAFAIHIAVFIHSKKIWYLILCVFFCSHRAHTPDFHTYQFVYQNFSILVTFLIFISRLYPRIVTYWPHTRISDIYLLYTILKKTLFLFLCR